MSFRAAAEATPSVAAHYREGLQALRKADRKRLRISAAHELDGSLDLDHALRRAKPRDARWDYGVGLDPLSQGGKVIWIEVHPASSSHIDAVLAKFNWLRAWLREEAPALNQIRPRYVWLAPGRVALPPNSPKRRQIESRGLLFRAKHLSLDELAD